MGFLQGDKRTVLIRKNILFSFLIKGWSGIVFILMVPLTLHCLGEYKNGIWLTISSLLIWIDNFDIGLGNGLRNNLAAALAQGDMEKARKAVSSTFFMLIIIMLPASLVLIGITHWSDMYSFLNVDCGQVDNLNSVVIVALAFVCTTFVFKFIGNFYMGLQLPAVSNLLVTLGQTLSLAATYVLYITQSGTLQTIVIANTLSPLVVYALCYPYTFCLRYKDLRPKLQYFDKLIVTNVFKLGVKFFLIQMASALLMMSANIVISKLFNPSLVTPYQIVYRYFVVIMLIFQVISIPYWSATTDAYQRGDIEWIRRSARKIRRLVYGICLVAFLMTVCSPIIFRLWVGGDVVIPFRLTALMCVYCCTLIMSMSYSNFLNGIGALRLQMIFTISAAILFIPLAMLAVKIHEDLSSLLIVFILVQLPTMIVNIIQFKRIINDTAKGIWLQ